jgi:hypothetical protein
VPLSLGVPTISQRLLARSEHVKASDLLVKLLVKVHDARPPVWTSAPNWTLRFAMVQVGSWVSQAASSEISIGEERASLARGKRRKGRNERMMPALMIQEVQSLRLSRQRVRFKVETR